jgi:phage protein D
MPTNQGVAGIRIKVAGKQIPTDAMHACVIEMDINQPDLATVTLNNVPAPDTTDPYSATIKMGDDVEVSVGATDGDPETLFTGKVVGIEPSWDVKGESKCVLRAVNKMHMLSHGKNSATYKNATDQDIVNKICQKYSLSADFGDTPPTEQYPHVYQHHMSDLEFLQERAAQINYEITVDDKNKKLFYQKRDLKKDSGIKFEFGKDAGKGEQQMQKFSARIMLQHQVKEVQIRGWDSNAKKNIVGKAQASVQLNTKGGHQHASDANAVSVHLDADIPIEDKSRADNVAQARQDEMSLNFVKAEAVCKGSPKLKPSMVITVTSQTGKDEPCKRFQGKYYVVSAMHRYSHKGSGSDGGYTTHLKLKADSTSA